MIYLFKRKSLPFLNIKSALKNFLIYTVIIYYTIFTKFSKIRQKVKNNPIVKKAQAVMLISYKEPCVISKRLNETRRGDALHGYYILYHYFKMFKNSPKIQKLLVKKAQVRLVTSCLIPA